MKYACSIKKTCCVCQEDLHNLSFHSAEKGRTSLKPYCKHCKPIYDGIKEGLIKKEIYIGLNFNTDQLKPNKHGYIAYLQDEFNLFEKIDLEEAKLLVKQGGAYVLSPSVIQGIVNQETKLENLRRFVLKRDNNKCYYCDEYGNTIDHVIPKWSGGQDTPLNTVCSCEECNRNKANLSKKSFLKRLKNGYFEGENKIIHVNQFKKCKCCSRILSGTHFENRKLTCKNCSYFQAAIHLHLVSKDEVSLFRVNEHLLSKETNILYMNKDGENICFISTKQALSLVQMGIAHIPKKNHVQLVLSFKQIKQIHPHFDPLTIESISDEKDFNTEKEQTIPTIYDTKHQLVGTANEKFIQTLKENHLIDSFINSINFRLNQTLEHISHKFYDLKILHHNQQKQYFKGNSPVLFTVDNYFDQLTSNNTHKLISNDDRYLGEFNKKITQSLFKDGHVTWRRGSTFKLNITQDKLYKVQPLLRKQIEGIQKKKSKKKKNYSKLWTKLQKSKISMFDHNGLYCKSIPKKMAFDLVKSNHADVTSDSRIQLNKSMSEVTRAMPKYAIKLML